MIGIMIPATIEVNFAVVSGKSFRSPDKCIKRLHATACLPTIRPVIQRLLPTSALASRGQTSSGRTYGQISTTGGTRSKPGVKLRTMSEAIELDDDSSTKNFADRNYAQDATYGDLETGSSGSNDDGPRRGPGPRTTVEAVAKDRQTSNGNGTDDCGGIHVRNEMTVSYEIRGPRE